ncbi:MAG: hypothetical protein ACI9XJ_002562 [Marivirga sp.]|jgi:hypothetical protein
MRSLLTIFSILLFLLNSSCKDKLVCAAYQSTYLLDEERQSNKFSFFDGDSLVLEASNIGLKKNIYGIRERDFGFWQKQRLLVVDQKDVYSKEVDSLLNSKEVAPAEMAESGVYLDSAMFNQDTVIALEVKEDQWSNTKRFHYNVDFVNYMLLVGNDVLKGQSAARDSAAANNGKEKIEATDSTANQSGGFMKRLFGGNKGPKANNGLDESDSATE